MNALLTTILKTFYNCINNAVIPSVPIKGSNFVDQLKGCLLLRLRSVE